MMYRCTAIFSVENDFSGDESQQRCYLFNLYTIDVRFVLLGITECHHSADSWISGLSFYNDRLISDDKPESSAPVFCIKLGITIGLFVIHVILPTTSPTKFFILII